MWIHLGTSHSTFGEFMTIVHDLLLDHSPVDRDKILSRLRRIQRRHEIKSSQGPTFRPAFVPLYDDDQVENMLGIPDFEQAKSDLPAFVSIPTIHLDKPRSRSFPENSHHVKSLLQYHYRFGIHNDTSQKSDFDLASILNGLRSPCVRELWCLALDSKNLVTVSWLRANSIWPILSQGARYSNQLTAAARIAMSQYFQGDLNPPHERLASLLTSKKGKRVLVITFFLGMIGQIVSASVPGGWMLDRLLRKIEKHLLGIDSMEIIRLASFIMVLHRPGTKKGQHDWLFGVLRTILAFSPAQYNGEPLRNLCALDEHMRHWVEVERTTWGQAEASEEVAHALRSLWSIAIRFTMNFHLNSDRHIYQLDRPSMWRRLLNYIRNDSKAKSAKTEVLYRPELKGKRGETLQDLEDELMIAIANLNRHHGTAQSELQASRDNENKDMLRSIQSFEDNLSLACLLRMCTISTPTRFSITSQDITDMFAGRISRLEWLVRDSASQPQVYQISAISDELRILKEILHSQMHVVSQVAQSLARAMANSISLKAVNGETPESADIHAPLGTGKEDSGHDRKTQIFNSLQRKSQLRHRQLAYDIERLQDATERLKSQAALFIKIKAEDQSIAIYVFTLVTVVFLPLSFATSYMGMNTSDIRDMEQGQWIFWAVGGVLTVVVMLSVWAIAYRGPRWKKVRQSRKLLHMD
ncbi:uncharacterized protein BKA55DRAFT_584383 [Fusarium redolens]|uniref:Uncharacterized protein n=1 Tax=Fusarium redolens TaxID=48865 RepID=A0A9P9JR94_FUSRE|nr:uncharacterized protein BKA55DRAFT_584383 [Fusarium redolens]KAH7224281.1 hypothetical protein BKA55DRAFT_584383 [Fusarium redolens]